MAHRHPVRTMIVVVSSGALLTLGTAIATAGPENPNFPLGNHATTPRGPEEKSEPEKPEPQKKAEKLGGGLASKIIDMGAGLAKCGLNIVAPTVKCE
jgi:hypothetical protein